MSDLMVLTRPYSDRELKELNSELASYGLPSYNFDFARQYDLDRLPWIELAMSTKSLVRRLKTIYLELKYNPNWTPESDSVFVGEPIFMDLVREIFGDRESHFIAHCLMTGSYVPVDFTDGTIAKGCLYTLGSSVNLLAELKELATLLHFEIEKYSPYFTQTQDYCMYVEEDFDDFANNILLEEKFMLFELYTVAKASIENNLMISIR